jgi:hypothetical protein
MSNVLDASKSNLGKLLASENIRIEHRQVQGPFFDVKDRVLVLPIWKDMDSDLYDLMIGHEVGHALYTPSDGWLDSIRDLGKNFKVFLNIVEDVRIEKKMKRKYPGLRKPMYNGYTQLLDRGFFGVTLEDMPSLPFADRLNIHFKMGARANIEFNETEQSLVDRIENAETWEEVMELAKELHGVSKRELDDLDNLFDDIMNSLDEGDVSYEMSDLNNGDMNESSDSSGSTGSPLSDKQLEKIKEKIEGMSPNAKNLFREWLENSEPSSITMDAMEKKEHELIDDKAYPYTYAAWPKLNTEDWVITAKTTHDLMNFSDVNPSQFDEAYATFMANNKKYISYLVKEFELRRNAKQFAKARVSKLGKLDMNKIWNYRLSEDLFLQSTVVPNGKNHGTIMIVDMSSSMSSNIAGTIEQTVALAMFCRKVNIPFDVYGFTDNNSAYEEFKYQGNNKMLRTHDIFNKHFSDRNERKENTLYINNEYFRLKQLLHYGMSTAEFNRAVRNLLMLAQIFQRHSYYYSDRTYYRIPTGMQLSGTPLNEAILVLKGVAEQFKKNTKVEILNTIILTDGDASYRPGLVKKNEYGDYDVQSLPGRRVIIEDDKRNQSATRANDLTPALLDLYKKVTGSRVIGYYLLSGRDYRRQISDMFYRYVNSPTTENFDAQYSREFSKNKFFGIKAYGYDTYYLIPGEELEIENVDMNKMLEKTVRNGKEVNKNSLLRAFKKMQNTKNISRVFLNQFIQALS